jgi:hypothetical protein
MLLAVGLAGCSATDHGRMRPLAIGVAAAEFRMLEQRWPQDGAELVATACRSDRALGRLPPQVPAADSQAACLAYFAAQTQQVSLRASASTLRIDVRDRATGARCRMTVRYAGDERATRMGTVAQVRTTLFHCR